MTDPPFVHKKPIHEIENRENPKNLEKSSQKATRTIDGIRTEQHIGDIGDNTHATENALPFVDRLRCGQAERSGTFLYRLVVEKYHSDGTVS